MRFGRILRRLNFKFRKDVRGGAAGRKAGSGRPDSIKGRLGKEELEAKESWEEQGGAGAGDKGVEGKGLDNAGGEENEPLEATFLFKSSLAF